MGTKLVQNNFSEGPEVKYETLLVQTSGLRLHQAGGAVVEQSLGTLFFANGPLDIGHWTNKGWMRLCTKEFPTASNNLSGNDSLSKSAPLTKCLRDMSHHHHHLHFGQKDHSVMSGHKDKQRNKKEAKTDDFWKISRPGLYVYNNLNSLFGYGQWS